MSLKDKLKFFFDILSSVNDLKVKFNQIRLNLAFKILKPPIYSYAKSAALVYLLQA